MGNINGKMVENIKESIDSIRNMELESTRGLMEGNTMGIGLIARGMAKGKLFM